MVVWELIFMMLILKIPIAYLGLVVWWAIKAEPKPPEPAIVTAELHPEIEPRSPWQAGVARLPRRPGPHGSPRSPRVRHAART